MDETDATLDAPPASASQSGLVETVDSRGISGSDRRGSGGRIEPGALIGRYVIVSRIGAGAMGEVYAAYDPELDRKLALKLLKARQGGATETARARLQREAQALAKLNHTNVVAVHDVGVHQGQVFLAMEFVDGQTLGTWAETGAPRPWRTIVEVFAAAGRGLAAAHDRGLVHRDFKPENVMIGSDGRVRVMDFGLARTRPAGEPSRGETGADSLATSSQSRAPGVGAALTRTGALMGTPAYMSPEQFAGAQVDARSDQFGFCVAFFEALHGARPFRGSTLAEIAVAVTEGKVTAPSAGARARGTTVPSWLDTIVRRGLRPDPDERFGDMNALLTAIDAGEGRRRRARVLVGLGVGGVAVGLAFGIQAWDEARRITACEASADSVDEIWNERTRAELRDGILGSGVSYAATTVERTLPAFDARAAALGQARTEVCLDATVRRLPAWDPDRLARANWCLDERELAMASLTRELAGGDRVAVRNAVVAASSFAPLGECRNADRLARAAAPPEDRAGLRDERERISAIDALLAAGRYDAALEAARVSVESSRGSWAPLAAAAKLREGEALEATGDYAAAESALEAAYFDAQSVGASQVAADAATRLVHVVGTRRARHVDGKRWARHATLAADAVGADALWRTGLDHELGIILDAAGEYGEARSLHERALELRERTLGSDHPEVATSLHHLSSVAFAEGEYDEALELRTRSLEVLERALGPDHPDLAYSLNNLANVYSARRDGDQARALHERALALRETALGPEHPDVASSLNNLAEVLQKQGLSDQAKPLYERALEIWGASLGPDHPRVAAVLSNLGAIAEGNGARDEAIARHRAALAAREKSLGPEHPDVAVSLNNLAVVHYSLGRYPEARSLHERALAIREAALGPEHPKVADSLNNLAVLDKRMGDMEGARVRYERALAILEKKLGPDHPNLGTALFNLGMHHEAMGEPARARQRYERTLAIWEAKLGPEHPMVGHPLAALAELAINEGRPAEAIPLARRAIELRASGAPFDLAAARFILATALWDAPSAEGRDRSGARELARSALEVLRGVEGEAESVAEIETWLRAHR